MKKMEKWIAKITMLVAIAAIVICTGRSTTVLAETTTATLQVTGVTPGDIFDVWKIIDISYDSSNNTMKYTYNSDFEAYFTATGVTIDMLMEQDFGSYGTLEKLLAGLPQYIYKNLHDETEPIGGEQTADADGKFSVQLEAGGYLVDPVSTNNIYQIMMTYIIPEVENGQFVYKDKIFNLSPKKTSASVTKTVSWNGGDFSETTYSQSAALDNDSNDSMKKVHYKIIIDVPKYTEPTTEGVFRLDVKDLLPAGILYAGELKVQGMASAAQTNNLAPIGTDKYTSTVPNIGESGTIIVDFSNKYDNIKSYEKIVITYDATIGSDALVHDPNTNTVTYRYVKYPYIYDAGMTDELKDDLTATMTSSAKVYTYGLKLTKQNDANEKIANAEFSIYRDWIDADGAGNKTTINYNNSEKEVTLVKSGLKTDTNGTFTITGLSNICYYVVETKAPAGYQLDSTPSMLDPTTMNDDPDGYYDLLVTNKKSNLALPSTGASGLVMFSFVGLAVMALGVVVLMFSMRKSKKR